MDLSEAATAWRRDGFVALPGYLDGLELDGAQRDLIEAYPTADDYHAAPGEGRNRVYTDDEFGGIIAFPFPTVSLCNLVVHDKLIALAEAILETRSRPGRQRCPTDISAPSAQTSMRVKYPGPVRPELSSPTAPIPSTEAPTSRPRVRLATAAMSVIGTPTTPGPAATPGATGHSTQTGTLS